MTYTVYIAALLDMSTRSRSVAGSDEAIIRVYRYRKGCIWCKKEERKRCISIHSVVRGLESVCYSPDMM